jgi:hypothetical protein
MDRHGLAIDLIGQASIIDGDTLELHGTRIHLSGIDKPEACSSAPVTRACSIAAMPRRRMNSTSSLHSRRSSCTAVELDKYGRTVATCSVAGIDLGEWIVRNGHVVDWPRYFKGKYRGGSASGRTGYGRGATSRLGSIAPACGWAARQADHPWTMRITIRERLRLLRFVQSGTFDIPAELANIFRYTRRFFEVQAA